MAFIITKGDITQMPVDAIVNAANSRLMAGGGVCGAIFSAAGHAPLTAACNAIGGCATGQAVITPGFKLAARHIIHAVGPIWQGGSCGEEALLKNCYTCALKLARENGCRSVAFPLISAGIYGYPKKEALLHAAAAINEFLKGSDLQVLLVLFDRPLYELAKSMAAELNARFE